MASPPLKRKSPDNDGDDDTVTVDQRLAQAFREAIIRAVDAHPFHPAANTFAVNVSLDQLAYVCIADDDRLKRAHTHLDLDVLLRRTKVSVVGRLASPAWRAANDLGFLDIKWGDTTLRNEVLLYVSTYATALPLGELHRVYQTLCETANCTVGDAEDTTVTFGVDDVTTTLQRLQRCVGAPFWRGLFTAVALRRTFRDAIDPLNRLVMAEGDPKLLPESDRSFAVRSFDADDLDDACGAWTFTVRTDVDAYIARDGMLASALRVDGVRRSN